MRYYNCMQAHFTSANFLLALLHFHCALRADLLHPGVRRMNVAISTKTHRAFRARPRHRRRLFSSCAVRSGCHIFVFYSYLVSHVTTERTETPLHRFRRLLCLLRGAGEPGPARLPCRGHPLRGGAQQLRHRRERGNQARRRPHGDFDCRSPPLVAAVLSVLPVDVVCSIVELAAVLGERDRPKKVAARINGRIRAAIGKRITCSIGCAPNRWLAKIAADLEKPDGLTVLPPPSAIFPSSSTRLAGRQHTPRRACR